MWSFGVQRTAQVSNICKRICLNVPVQIYMRGDLQQADCLSWFILLIHKFFPKGYSRYKLKLHHNQRFLMPVPSCNIAQLVQLGIQREGGVDPRPGKDAETTDHDISPFVKLCRAVCPNGLKSLVNILRELFFHLHSQLNSWLACTQPLDGGVGGGGTQRWVDQLPAVPKSD